MYFSIWIKRRNPNPRQRIHRSPNHLGHNHPSRVIEVDGVVIHVPIEIDPGFEAQRIFGQEPSHLRVVVTGPIVVEAGTGVCQASCPVISNTNYQILVFWLGSPWED